MSSDEEVSLSLSSPKCGVVSALCMNFTKLTRIPAGKKSMTPQHVMMELATVLFCFVSVYSAGSFSFSIV